MRIWKKFRAALNCKKNSSSSNKMTTVGCGNYAIDDLEAKVSLLRPRSPMDTWEVVSDRVASEISRVTRDAQTQLQAACRDFVSEKVTLLHLKLPKPPWIEELNRLGHQETIKPGSKKMGSIEHSRRAQD